MQAIVAYIPVLHQGYYDFLSKYPKAEVFILDESIGRDFEQYRKELRKLRPDLIISALQAWKLNQKVQKISTAELASLEQDEIIMPSEDISHTLAGKYLAKKKITYYPVFLRWDRLKSNANTTPSPDHIISKSEFDREMMGLVSKIAAKSTNIWRRVGALIVKDGKVGGISSNRHQPTDQTAWIDGDVRMNFGKGVGIEMSTDMHAEALLIADAARRGESLEGSDLYVSTFPCPPCAMLIAKAGFKRCLYVEGYAVLDGERVMKANDVELIKVDVELPQDRAETYRPYPEK